MPLVAARTRLLAPHPPTAATGVTALLDTSGDPLLDTSGDPLLEA